MNGGSGASEALLIVDPQVDFCPGGALAVPDGDRIFAPINAASKRFPVVAASRDWHPPMHMSFKEQGGPWPAHCVQDTKGAEFHPLLDESRIEHVVSKGTDPRLEAYSAFSGTDLADWFRERRVERIYVAGLATDYCVRQTALDALALGFKVTVLADAVAAVEVEPGNGARALTEMKLAGADVASVSGLAAA